MSAESPAKERENMAPSQGASLVEEGRDITGETVLGMRVAAYREPVEVEGVGNVGHRYSEHWSTPGQGAERLFSEADVRHAFTTLRAERDRAVAIITALSDEYDRDEECDPIRINRLIEEGQELLSTLTSKEGADHG